jgi:hypothetical protein
VVNRIPFSVYDFFGYLAAGVLVLAAIDYAFDGGWVLNKDLGIVFSVFWIGVAYIIGHIVANVSGYLLETKLVRRVLVSPEETLFQAKKTTGWARIFPNFYEPFPVELQERILKKAKGEASIDRPGRALFLHCHSIVKRDEATQARLNAFLNLYGFSRNISTAAALAFIVLLADVLVGTVKDSEWIWLLAAMIAAVGMLYRYLKFFKHYTMEVLVTYPELD